MKFLLFSKIGFEVSHPIALIESYCFQSDFFSNFDLKPDKTVEDANKIGAHIPTKKNPKIIKEIKKITKCTKNLKIFGNDIDSFLKISNESRNEQIKEFTDKAIKKLMDIDGIGLPKSTKVYHTLHPKIIPMIDNPLLKMYKQEIIKIKINTPLSEEQLYQLFVAFYNNFKDETNWHNISQLHEKLSETGITWQMRSRGESGLTKVRILIYSGGHFSRLKTKIKN